MTMPEAAVFQDPASLSLQRAFLKWQCRVRQTAMRAHDGRPDEGIVPALFLPDAGESPGHIVTVLNKTEDFSVTPELNYMFARTNDPAQRRDQAIRFLSSAYYQKAVEFSDILTATFASGSSSAAKIHAAGRVCLVFDAFAQIFRLECNVRRLEAGDWLYQATLAHNRLFNPALPADTVVLGFEPDWSRSSSDPDYR